MVEIEQEELDRLRNIETAHAQLQQEHADLQARHNTLKDDYIGLSKGQRENSNNKTDTFDDICKQRYGK